MDEQNKKNETTLESEKTNVANGNNTKENSEGIRIRIGTVGNFVLAAFVILIIGTGALTYYLIHTAKDDYDKQYNELITSLPDIQTNTVEQEDEEVTIANIIDSAIIDATSGNFSQNQEPTTSDSSKVIRNESLVVLYNGMILKTDTMDEIQLQYIDSKSDQSDKYVITYYSYENYAFNYSKLGTFSQPIGEGLVKLEGVGKVAISEDYDAIPRDVKVVNTIPSIVSDNNVSVKDYDTYKTLIVDLDGNGTEEYLLVLANKTTGFSKIVLVDSKGVKVNDLASIEKSKWKKDSTSEYYLSINNLEIIDIDNDGIMEILVEIPQAVGNSTVSLLKYNNGILQGKTGIECSLVAE